MPNWVFNYVDVDGDKKELVRLKETMAKPTPFEEGDSVFNFHNIVTIPADKVEEYNTANGWANGERTGDTEFNWYNWNLANWETKWNAREATLTEDNSGALRYYFETAWSPVNDLLLLLSEQFPTLEFVYEYEEEQGWGGILEFQNGILDLRKEWDVPTSHADWVAIDREQQCVCNHDFDTYPDCPKEEGEK
jgi:hypothetical protein